MVLSLAGTREQGDPLRSRAASAQEVKRFDARACAKLPFITILVSSFPVRIMLQHSWAEKAVDFTHLTLS